MTRDQAIALMIHIEGGFVDNPRDPGGATKNGITQKTYTAWLVKQSRETTVGWPSSVADLAVGEAAMIYRDVDWDAMRLDEMPAPLAVLMLNSAVNQGEPTAVRLLQAALGITQDGIVGDATIAHAHSWVSPYMPEQSLAEEYAARVAVRYARLDGTEDQFELGWFRRLFRVYTAALNS